MVNYCVAAGICLLLSLLAFWIDLPAIAWINSANIGGDLKKGVELAEVFANFIGVFFIGLTVAVVDRDSRRKVIRLMLTALLASLAANLAKTTFERTRPRAALQMDADHEAVLFPKFKLGNFGERQQQSFPSGHSATAFGLALGLIAIYPHGRYLFLTLAIFAACQRFVDLFHYPSDIFAGAAIGILAAGLLHWPAGIGRFFDDFERPVKQPDIPQATA